MDIKSKWHNSSSNTIFPEFYTREETISEVQENFNIRRYQGAEGFKVKIDNIETQVIIQSHSNPLNEGKYDRKIHVPIDTVIQTGSIVEWEDNKWLVTSSIDNLQAYKTASIVKCTETIQLYKNGISYKIPCVIGNDVTGSDENDTKYLSVVAGQIVVQVPNNSITQMISVNDIYKLGRFSYKCLQPSDVVKQGLLVIPMQYSDVEQQLPTFSIKIINSNISTDIDTPIQLQTEVYDGISTSPLPSPSLVYESSDETIATVDSNGKVTPISVDNVIITCKLGFDETVSSSINVEIKSVTQDNFTYSITSDISPISECKVNQTKVFTVHKYNNGSEITGKFNVSVVDTGVPITTYQLKTVFGSNAFSLKALKSTYYLKVHVVDIENLNVNTNYLDIEIKLRSSM